MNYALDRRVEYLADLLAKGLILSRQWAAFRHLR